ncbi:MAG: helix-turn-helix transcriptional regulator [Clostridiales bacterium]|nr:helix-turn-helix transcriptional regulator [Clostridiales bacterium]
MIDYTALGHRIRTLRTASGLTQAELAERVGISASFLGHIERGTRVLSVDTLAALCAALSATPNDLLGMAHAALAAQLPARVTVSVPALLQDVADLLKKQQISE